MQLIYNKESQSFSETITPMTHIISQDAWKESEGYIYDPNKQRLYLYKSGDECTDTTGGWRSGVGIFRPADNGKLEKSSDRMTLTQYRWGQVGSGHNAFGVSTTNKIDISQYRKVFIEAAGDLNTFTLCAISTFGTDSFNGVACNVMLASSQGGVAEGNISNNGSFYFSLDAYTNSPPSPAVTIFNIYLE